jgi:hypothetical protein
MHGSVRRAFKRFRKETVAAYTRALCTRVQIPSGAPGPRRVLLLKAPLPSLILIRFCATLITTKLHTYTCSFEMTQVSVLHREFFQGNSLVVGEREVVTISGKYYYKRKQTNKRSSNLELEI